MRFDLLDGFRGIAAIVVVLLHATINAGHKEFLPLAHMAVDFFFCLSGFVICHAYEQRLTAGLGLLPFFKARIVRLYPMILIGVVMGFAVLGFRILAEHQRAWIAPGTVTFVLNALLLPSPLLTLGYDAAWPLNGPQWSLTFEVLANVVYGAFLHRLRGAKFHALTALSGAVLAWTIFSKAGVDFGWRWHELHLGLARVMFPFMLGVSLYRMHRAIPAQRPGLGLATVLCLVLILGLAVPHGLVDATTWTLGFVFFVTPALVWFGARVLVGGRMRMACAFLGAMSYPVYATHQPILRFIQVVCAKYHLPPDTEFLLYSVAVLGCFLLAWGLMRWVEEPLRLFLRSRLFVTERATAP